MRMAWCVTEQTIRNTFHSEKTWNRQRIERIKLILFHFCPLHLLHPVHLLMVFDLFSVESFHASR